MTFGAWEPLGTATPPAGPGVWQLRVRDGLIDYPRGRSAMIAYGADDAALASAVERLRAAIMVAPIGDMPPVLIRFASAAAARGEAARLLDDFTRRFGAPPLWQHHVEAL